MKAIINSVKHIVQKSLTVIQEQTVSALTVATAVTVEPSSPPHVVVGAVVKAVFLEYWLMGESSQPCTATWILEKIQNSGASATQSQMQALDSYENKRNILKMGQGLIGDSNTNPIPIIREWIKIPKGKQRFAQGDDLKFTVSVIGDADNGAEICGFALFKEYQ